MTRLEVSSMLVNADDAGRFWGGGKAWKERPGC
jgi:hypothetical protein